MEKKTIKPKTSPYGFFVKMCHEEHRRKFPDEAVTTKEIAKRCSVKWKDMTVEQKARFYDLAKRDAKRYSTESGSSDAPTRKRHKKDKDPAAPKKAMSAYFFFSNSKRAEVMAANPGMKITEVAKLLGQAWKDVSVEEKSVFEKMAQNDKERYSQEMEKYKGSASCSKKDEDQEEDVVGIVDHMEESS